MAIDAALGNAWLGRGLCRIRRGDAAGGREDLLVAAALEPQRAELRSYLGKAYANADDYTRAYKELRLAKNLDPNDPTAWLYSALLEQQDNRINDAIGDLKKSEDLNDNRSVYRSQLLLDQDLAVRGANLAAMYQDAGMKEVGMIEASRAANYDYTDYSAHLFLANSYSQLVGPNAIDLRYETAMENEYLLANLLSPAAVGAISPTVSPQAFSKLFEHDQPGIVSDTEYLSRGAWSEMGAQYGTEGNFSFNLEETYQFDPGERANEDFQREEIMLTLKQQITPNDGVYFQALAYDANGGDTRQYYSPEMASPDYRFKETQDPTVVLGVPTTKGVQASTRCYCLPGLMTPRRSRIPPSRRCSSSTRNTSPSPSLGCELLPRWMVSPCIKTLKPSPRFIPWNCNKSGKRSSTTQSLAGDCNMATLRPITCNLCHPALGPVFPVDPAPAAEQDYNSDFDRVTFYGYHEWQIFDPLQLIGGLTYDWLKYPGNIQTGPISSEENTTSHLSPKAGLIWTPAKETTIRLAYTRSMGGVSLDQSYQLEPSQVAGFVQSFRSVIPQSVANESPGADFQTFDISLEREFRTGTWLEISGQSLDSHDAQFVGVFDALPPELHRAVPSLQGEDLVYHENSLEITANQLVGREWSLGAQYRFTKSTLNVDFPSVPALLTSQNFEPHQEAQADLQQVNLFAIYNHPSGFFLRGEALWNGQSNEGYTPGLAGASFWQFNAFAGWRFLHRRAEARIGLLNITSQDYELNPLNPHEEYPHERTLSMRLLMNF